MGAHDIYAATKPWQRKADDEAEDGADEGESFVDYYVQNIGQARTYLKDLSNYIGSYSDAASFGAEVTARADAAREWLDVLEQDRRMTAKDCVAVAGGLSAYVAGRTRSGAIEALRKLIMADARGCNQIYQAANSRPW